MPGPLLALALVLPVGALLAGALWLSRPRGEIKKVVLLVTARSEMEADLWAEKLRLAGVKAFLRAPRHNRIVSITTFGVEPDPWPCEVWVLGKDERVARRILGLADFVA
jgi:hypothetical protein